MKKPLIIDGEGEVMRRLTRRVVPVIALAIGLALMAVQGHGDKISESFSKTKTWLETFITQKANLKKGDITLKINAVQGYIEIEGNQKKVPGPKGQTTNYKCNFFLVVEPQGTGKGKGLLFYPKKINETGHCPDITWPLLYGTGISEWGQEARGHFDNKCPEKNKWKPEVYYYSDRVTFTMKKILRMKPLPSRRRLPIQK